MSGKKRQNQGIYVKIDWDRFDVPVASAKFAAERTHCLVQGYASQGPEAPLSLLTASCYLQGVTDTVAMLDKKPEIIEAWRQPTAEWEDYGH